MDTDSHPASFHSLNSLDGDDLGLGDLDMMSPGPQKSFLTSRPKTKVLALPAAISHPYSLS